MADPIRPMMKKGKSKDKNKAAREPDGKTMEWHEELPDWEPEKSLSIHHFLAAKGWPVDRVRNRLGNPYYRLGPFPRLGVQPCPIG